MKLARVVFQALVGSCAGGAAGVIIVGLLGGLSGLPYILTHARLKNGPFTMFFASMVVHGANDGMGLGAPFGAVIGLVTGMILGMRSGGSRGATAGSAKTGFSGAMAGKPAVPLAGDFATAAHPPDKGITSTDSFSLPRSCCLVVVTVLAIPGAQALWGVINWHRERAAFDRFVAEVTGRGGEARVESAAVWSGTIESVELNLSGTEISDADLERLAHIEMFKRVSSLSLAGTRITDRGVALLAGHPRLMSLDLSRTRVTDRSLESIARTFAGTLNLSGTGITDAALSILREQPDHCPIRSVALTDTKVTEAKVRELGKAQWMMNITYDSSKSPRHTR